MLEPTGPETYALVDTPVGMMTARVPGKVTQRVGEKVFLRWSPNDAHLFDASTEQRVA
jgi:multiple sugar transport system ATP-binding protein